MTNVGIHHPNSISECTNFSHFCNVKLNANVNVICRMYNIHPYLNVICLKLDSCSVESLSWFLLLLIGTPSIHKHYACHHQFYKPPSLTCLTNPYHNNPYPYPSCQKHVSWILGVTFSTKNPKTILKWWHLHQCFLLVLHLGTNEIQVDVDTCWILALTGLLRDRKIAREVVLPESTFFQFVDLW